MTILYENLDDVLEVRVLLYISIESSRGFPSTHHTVDTHIRTPPPPPTCKMGRFLTHPSLIFCLFVYFWQNPG
jgi:hypothetical protein